MPRPDFAILPSIEREKRTLVANPFKSECVRLGTPLSLEDPRHLAEGHLDHYNNLRLNRAIGHITPKDMLAGRQEEVHAGRDRKLEA